MSLDIDHSLGPAALQRIGSAILKAYLNPSFGALPKREIDQVIFRELWQTGIFGEQADLQHISRLLSVPLAKVKALVYDMQLRDPSKDVNWFRDALLERLKVTRIVQREQRVEFGIQDPLLRLELEARLRNKGGFPDYSFNRDLLRIQFANFADLLGSLMNEQQQRALLKEMVKLAPPSGSPGPNETAWQQAWRSFLTKAAGQAGVRTADLSFDMLNLALGNIPGLLKALLSH